MHHRYLSISAAALAVAALCYVLAGQKHRLRADAKDNQAELTSHGEYLVNEVAHCTHCHTPQDAKGEPIPAKQLQGATLPIMPKKETKNWADKSPDITSSGLAGKWSEEQMTKFLMNGANPDDEKPRPPMPIFHLKEKDARAVTLYLRSLPGKK
jgi:fructose 5-dehydrogenase cytochrome subunit